VPHGTGAVGVQPRCAGLALRIVHAAPDAMRMREVALVTPARAGENTAHLAQRLRGQRDTTRALAVLTAQLTETEVAVVGEPPYDEKAHPPAASPHPRRPAPHPGVPRCLPGARRLR
jgi:hypothetical protein